MNLPDDGHRPLFPPLSWRPEVMDGRVCIVCGWKDGADNGPVLHVQHVGHLLEFHHGEPDAADLPSLVTRHMTQPVVEDVSTEPMRIWLALDPQTERIHVQAHEWVDGDFPAGARGARWPRRETEVDPRLWQRLMAGGMSPQEQDDVHQLWWNDASQEGGPPWPG